MIVDATKHVVIIGGGFGGMRGAQQDEGQARRLMLGRHGELRADFARLATELSDESRRIEYQRSQNRTG
jgi:NADPH-dependent 2,4-dienoyl-CoA reductase/sulfur reductase-like enzyme